jgi:hypothetical protein
LESLTTGGFAAGHVVLIGAFGEAEVLQGSYC